MAGTAAAGSHPAPRGSPFPPIAEYAFLSDCEVSALIAPSGNVEWMCLPRMDGPSIFAAMLDRDAGSFRLGPADAFVPAGRRYLPGTMVLETTWGLPSGWAVVRDVLLVGPWRHDNRRSGTHRRVPSDHGAERVLLTPELINRVSALHLDQVPVLSAVTAVLSNLVSNVPAVLVMQPFVASLKNHDTAWLVVAMASTLAGNFTVLGSIANLIVVQKAAAGGVEIGFWDYFRVGAPLTIITLVIGTLWLWL